MGVEVAVGCFLLAVLELLLVFFLAFNSVLIFLFPSVSLELVLKKKIDLSRSSLSAQFCRDDSNYRFW